MGFLLALILWLFAAPAHGGFNEPVGCVQLPALTGDVTTSSGSCATTEVWHRISTQTVSAGASIAFTGLATYDIYRMECQGVFNATAGNMFLQVGEGGTPTWNTSGYQYAYNSGDSSTATVSGGNSASATGVLVVGSVSAQAIANSVSFEVRISNVTATDVIKHVLIRHSRFTGGNTGYANIGGAYTGSNNAVTSFRIIAASGNITGKCTLLALVP